jgi:pimeloyl-ACP methyl ester carboxylesterase
MEQVRFEGAGLTLAADIEGPADGRPLLFMHGGGQTRQSWGKALHQAAQHGYRACALDLRGHGESDWSPDGHYDIDSFAADARAVLRTWDQPAVLIGASLGGLTSLIVAANPPPKVAGLILVDIAVRNEEAGTREISEFMNGAPDGFANIDEAADAVAAYLPHRPRPKDASGLMRNLREREDGRLVWHWDPTLFTNMAKGNRSRALHEDYLETAARQLEVPTLLIRGGRSRVLSREGAEHFLQIAPHAEYVDVNDADHMVAGDANDLFNEAVFSFIGGLKAGTPA